MSSHKNEINRGFVGFASKIQEELDEYVDSIQQGVKIMAHLELSDLYGALEAHAHSLGLTMNDLNQMSIKTKKMFSDGIRKSCTNIDNMKSILPIDCFTYAFELTEHQWIIVHQPGTTMLDLPRSKVEVLDGIILVGPTATTSALFGSDSVKNVYYDQYSTFYIESGLRIDLQRSCILNVIGDESLDEFMNDRYKTIESASLKDDESYKKLLQRCCEYFNSHINVD